MTEPARRPRRSIRDLGVGPLGQIVSGVITYAATLGLVMAFGAIDRYVAFFAAPAALLIVTVYVMVRWGWGSFPIGVFLGLIATCLVPLGLGGF